MFNAVALAIIGAHCALNGALYRITGNFFHTVGTADFVISLANTAVAFAVLAWGPEGAPLSYAILEHPIEMHCWWFFVQLPGFLLLKQQYTRDTSPATWRFMVTHHCCVTAFGVIMYLFPVLAAYASGDVTPYAFFCLWQGGNGFAYPLHHLVSSGVIGQRTAARANFFPWLFGAAHLTFEVLCVRSAWRSLWRPDRPRLQASPETCACPVVECQRRKVPSTSRRGN
eukprot:m51a1_g7357 hypothetical protein (227) ;mRNA; f:34490-35305